MCAKFQKIQFNDGKGNYTAGLVITPNELPIVARLGELSKLFPLYEVPKMKIIQAGTIFNNYNDAFNEQLRKD
jgi:hypothetical protein